MWLCVFVSVKHKLTDLFDVPIQAEEVEDASAVHLGCMQAAHHGDGAGGRAHVRRGLGQWVGHHFGHVVGVPLVPVVAWQGQ